MALRSQKELWNSFKSMATGQFQSISGLQTAVAAEVPDAPQRSVPTDRLAGLRENWRHDIVSGFILFLIALPLSLGIAMASGMPPMSGIIAACIGGIVVSQISGSYVTINGPAAGLIVVILDGVQVLGGGAQGYHNTLTAIVVAGLCSLSKFERTERKHRLEFAYAPPFFVFGFIETGAPCAMARETTTTRTRIQTGRTIYFVV